MNSIPFILYTIGFILISAVRGFFTWKYKNTPKARTETNVTDRVLLFFTGIAMIIPFIHRFSNFLDFADYELSIYFSITGFLFFLFATWLLYRSHRDLGNAWAARPGINQQQKLVTTGVYSKIRHPMYAAHILWGIAQILLIHNWIVGFSLYIFSMLLYLNRVNREERILYQEFGEKYLNYMKRTGRILPVKN